MADNASKILIDRWRGGDQQAAAELFQRYAHRLLGLAQRHMGQWMTRRVDAEDVVQSVFNSFFVRTRDGAFVLQETGDLWRLLVTMTLNKLDDQIRHHTADKRNVAQEDHFASEDSLHGLRPEVLAREPSPEEAAALADMVQQILTPLDPLARKVVEMRLQGYQMGEIATQTGYCQRTVRRLLNRFKEQMEWDLLENSGTSS
jgi:RNA polymerase sigma-70 factor (ECF subfamily)